MFWKRKTVPAPQPDRCAEVENALPLGSYVLYLGREGVVVSHHKMAPDPVWDEWLHVDHPAGVQELFIPY